MGFSRRDFLKYSGTALGASALVSRFGMMSAMAQSGPDYKALVCIYLHGGNDGFNTVVPTEANEYAYYTSVRKPIALPLTGAGSVLGLNAPATPLANGRTLGLHPSLPELQTLWNSQKLAVMCNLGTLISPVTPAQYRADKTTRPSALFDHNAQTQAWNSFNGDGWGQAIGSALSNLNTNPRIPSLLNVAYDSSIFLAGTQPYISLAPGASLTLSGFKSPPTSDARYNALRAIQKLPSESALVNVIGNGTSQSIDNGQLASSALSAANIATVFPKTGLGNQLLQIAKIISIRSQLNQTARQVFYCDMGGFDTHANQLVAQASDLQQLSQAMSAFYAATVELGVSSAVTTFTLSEFGRTMQNSNDGTDHAWGSQAFIMGDSVKGGDFYGKYPSLVLGGADDADSGTGSRGRFVPTTSVDQYGATLGSWFGLSPTALAAAFPNLSRFSPGNLGFMKP